MTGGQAWEGATRMTLGDWAEKHWRWLVLLFWLAASAYMLWERWDAIRLFALGDTDDNMRMMQVRDLIAGQGWFDLRQYRLSPPEGADIHWSRLVDLPIAAIYLVLGPVDRRPRRRAGGGGDRAAAADAGRDVRDRGDRPPADRRRRLRDRHRACRLRRLGARHVGAACGSTIMAGSSRCWRSTMMALTDPKRARGGAIAGAATALSLAIGLEMLLYLAIAGATIGLRWIHDRDEAKRLFAYGVVARRRLRARLRRLRLLRQSRCRSATRCRRSGCRRCSPRARRRSCWRWRARATGPLRLGLGALAGGLDRRRLRPGLAGLPRPAGAGAAGARPALAQQGARGDAGLRPRLRHRDPDRHSADRRPDRLRADALDRPATTRSASSAGPRSPRPALLAAALLLWQTRAGPAAQMLSAPGATALAWVAILWLMSLRHMLAAGRRRGRRLPRRLGARRAAISPPSGRTSRRAPIASRSTSPTGAARRCATCAPVALQPRGQRPDLRRSRPAADHGDAAKCGRSAPITAIRGRSST